MSTLDRNYVLAPSHHLLTNCQSNVLMGLRLIEKLDEFPAQLFTFRTIHRELKQNATLQHRKNCLQDHVTSLNNARNCMAHTNGVVTQQHCKNPDHDKLTIQGRRFKLFFKRDDLEVAAVVGKAGPENAALMLGAEDFQIEFALGQGIELSLKQFLDILNTCVFVRADIDLKLGTETPLEGAGESP